MPMTINGSGTITGLTAGGLPDGTVQPADLTTGAPSWDGSGNLSFNSGYGSVATAYGCRAWVNFNGTGTVAIRASGNVSSITDNGIGTYTVNFSNAMPDANYSPQCLVNDDSIANRGVNVQGGGIAAGSCRVTVFGIGSGGQDSSGMYVSVFR